tara:strand:- start:9609 stop:9941 length:333 start_codon:yes stop_codon:yes gene_type:complete
MAAPLAGQDKQPIATVLRDFTEAPQNLEFPRGRVNHYLFHNEGWSITNAKIDEPILSIDCCNVEKSGDVRGIECAFKRLDKAIPNGGVTRGRPFGGTLGAHRTRVNGFNV